MSVKLPRDAEGREIPLDTVALYDDGGNVHSVRRFMYTNDFDLGDKWINSWIAVVDDYKTAKPEQMYLNKPDSWEKLEEDLSRAAKYDAVVASCRYFTADRCADCRMHNGFTCGTRKTERAFADVLERIRKLRGES